MPCEKYQTAWIASAVTDADLTPEIRSHLAGCTSCAAEFAQQRSLIAAIDANLACTMNAPVPVAMLQRLGARVAQQTPRRSLNLRWLYATTVLATVAAMILLALPRLRTHKSNSYTVTLSQTTKSPAEHRLQMVPLPLLPATPEQIQRDRKRHVRRAPPLQPEVLVPPDERIGLDQLIADLNRRADLPAVIVKPLQHQPEQGVARLKTPDIETASLVVQPLQESNVE